MHLAKSFNISNLNIGKMCMTLYNSYLIHYFSIFIGNRFLKFVLNVEFSFLIRCGVSIYFLC